MEEIGIGFKYSIIRKDSLGETIKLKYEVIGIKYGNAEGSLSMSHWKTRDDALFGREKYLQILLLPSFDDMTDHQLAIFWKSEQELRHDIEEDLKMLITQRKYFLEKPIRRYFPLNRENQRRRLIGS